jgi:hypothetical protein
MAKESHWGDINQGAYEKSTVAASRRKNAGDGVAGVFICEGIGG